MGKQNVYGKIRTVFLTAFFLLAVHAFAQYDYKNMRIGAEVNGQPVSTDKVTLHDNDTCTLFLLDKEGRKVTYLSSDENYSFEWNLRFPMMSGDVKSGKISTNECDSIIGVRITPTGFFSMNFVNEKADREKSYRYKCLKDGEITCDLKRGRDLWYLYKRPVTLEVLPSEPKINIVDNYIASDEEYGTYPFTTLEVVADNFDYGLIYFSDFPNFYGEYFEYPCQIPYRVDIDFGSFETRYKCETFNAYGVSGSDEVFPDWQNASVSDPDNERISISCKDNVCNIASKSIMRQISVYDNGGRIVYSVSDKAGVEIRLAKGLYILSITAKDGKTTRKKLLMK